MKKNYFLKGVLTSVILLFGVQFIFAQGSSRSFWTNKNQDQMRANQRTWYPNHYQSFSLQSSDLKNFLANAPMETSVASRQSSFIIELPMPDGNFNRYTLVESPVMEAGLAAAYPSIKTYAGQGIDDPTATIRCDMTQFGFHSYVLSANGTVYIDPFVFGNTDDYIVYYKQDVPAALYKFDCQLKTQEEKSELHNDHDRVYQPNSVQAIGSQLRTYRLALAADGEYTAYYGGTRAGALAGMVTTMNRVNGVYERELDIHMNLIANDTLLIYTNGATDPYTNNNGGTMLGENVTTCNNVIGSGFYDIGHVFSTGGGGIAGLGVVCGSNLNKARGVTGSPGPVGDAYDIDYVAHEMGHQFGGNHTFNSTSSSCGGGNVSAGAAYEPGSGSTIMAYAGICPPNDLQAHSDAYFHTKNFDEIISYSQSSTGNTCPVTTNTGNGAPVLTMPTTLFHSIPYQTPFKLTATATDPQNDPVTFCWEEYDLGAQGNWNAPVGNAPVYRSFNPTTSGTRMFPKLNKILTPTSTDIGEFFATYARSLTFRCTARDNRSGGGGVIHNTSVATVSLVNTGTPFAITAPNVAGISWLAGSTQTVTWNVAQTTASPINTPTVNIYLSTNNGTSFPITIATGVANNGSYSFSVPNNPTGTARIMVEANGNIFFDINDRTFSITPVGIDELNISNNINIYPNPAANEFHFVVNTLTSGKCRITLNDIAGRTVKEITFEKGQVLADRSVDLSDLSNGMYIVRFELPEGVAEKKLIKE